MKTKFLLAMMLVGATSLFAQETKVKKTDSVKQSKKLSIDGKRDTTRIHIGHKEILIVGKKVAIDSVKQKKQKENAKFRGHWAGFEMGINGYAKQNYDGYEVQDFMETKPIKSIAVRFNLVQMNFNLQKKKDNIGLLTGLGLESRDYRFSNSYTIENVDGRVQPQLLEYERLKKSKLNVCYATLPVLLEFQFPQQNADRFYVSFGVEGGLRLTSHTKIKYKENGGWKKSKNHNNFNLNNWKLDAQFRMGYRGVNLFFNYGLVNLFKDNKAPELTPFTVGLSVVSF
ncbi:MAG: hypothetical protein KGV44_10695 [Flavobacteriaceae bacterium]|nr:hypothetical protein [Flavobacteriaceae bacterium]